MKQRKNSLVIYWKQLGDLLLMEPALTKLASTTKSKVFIATKPEFSPLFSLMNSVCIAPTKTLKNISYVYSFDGRFRACIRALFTFCKIKHLIISDLKSLKWWHKFFFKEISIIDTSEKYRAEYFFDAINISSDFLFRPPKLNKPPKSWKPKCLPEKYILIHATSAWRNKSWSPQFWANTINKLHGMGIGPFVITGGNSVWEAKYIDSLLSKIDCKVLNLCGKTNIKEYLAAIHHASLVVAIDGSAAHIASAFNRPVLTLFGPTHPIHWCLPSDTTHFIDARLFSKYRKPSVDFIPYQVVIDETTRMWKLYK
jgi:ADP-heptose:LPS heptosyltransferase